MNHKVMTSNRALLVELFVEELPPKALKKLGEAFAAALAASLKAQGLAGDDSVVSLAVVPGTGEEAGADDENEAPEVETPETEGEENAEAYKGTALLTICENGYGKATAPSAYRMQSRGGKGVIAIKTSRRNGMVVGLRAVEPEGEVIIVTTGGTLLRIPVSEIRVIGRNTQGVRLINLGDDEKVVSFEHFCEREVGDEDKT